MSLKAQSEATDTVKVRAGSASSPTIDQVLAALPPALVVAGDGEDRFVAGPVGAFVLVPAPAPGPALGGAADRLLTLTQRTRGELGRHLAWVPFVHALLVSTSRRLRRAAVTVAPVDLLAVVLTQGPEVVDPATLGALRRAVDQGALGVWRPAVIDTGPAGGRIDLCPPPPIPHLARPS